MPDSSIHETFREESNEILEDFEKAVLELESDTGNNELLNRAFRDLHTLKGSAGMLGLELLENFAHEAENVFSEIRSGRSEITSEIIQWSLDAVDILYRLVNDAFSDTGAGEELQADVEELISEAELDLEEQKTASRTVEQHQGKRGARSIKVKTERLEDLLKLVGEMVALQLNLAHLSKQKEDDEFTGLSDRMERVLRDLRILSNELHMTPIGDLFSTYKRSIRDIASKSGKKVNLVTSGEDTEFDRSIYEGLSESLLHLIRNSVDHGIEPADDRITKGKSPEGEILLEAFYRGLNGVIRIRDDGKGIDPEVIRKRASANGLIAEDDKLSKAEIFELLYHPGFSTAEKVSSVSGRGVGMDAVRRSIQALHGKINIDSVNGEGTEITITLPLSISSTDSMLVLIDNTNYLIPLGYVQECISIESENCGRAMIRYRERMISSIVLKDFFGDGSPSENAGKEAVIVRNESTEAALVVDEIKGIYSSVIKPLPDMFKEVRYLSGSALLGDGSTAFVLEILNLISEAETSDRGR